MVLNGKKQIGFKAPNFVLFLILQCSVSNEISDLYYKHATIINDNSSIISKWSSKVIDDARGIIYDRQMFIIQATELNSSS
jgi:hypothetical protein